MANDAMVQAASAVYGRLAGDVTLSGLLPGGVWDTPAPVDVETYPLVALAILPARIDYTMTGPYRWVFDVRVTALDKSEAVEAAGAVMDRVLVLLQDADDTDLPMTDFNVLYCRKQTSTKMTPIREGERFQQLMDGYRLEVTPA